MTVLDYTVLYNLQGLRHRLHEIEVLFDP